MITKPLVYIYQLRSPGKHLSNKTVAFLPIRKAKHLLGRNSKEQQKELRLPHFEVVF